jgi:hypothetical protein
MRMYIAKLVCCVPGPVRSIEGPAINPDSNDLHLAVLKEQEYLVIYDTETISVVTEGSKKDTMKHERPCTL